jgi:Tfp pilus assembly protein PilF
MTINTQYLQSALTALLRAAELAPTDPKIRYNLALLYFNLGQEEMAFQNLQKTIDLKPNYDAPHYALALFYEQKGQKEKAREEFQYILDNINPAYQPAIEKLKSFKD